MNTIAKVLSVASIGVSLCLCGSLRAEEVTQVRRSTANTDEVRVSWMGFAVAPTGRVFQDEGNSENGARSNAKNECEQNVGRTCRAISVPSNWNVSAVTCTGGSFIAGSKDGPASDIAQRKASDAGVDQDTCNNVFNY